MKAMIKIISIFILTIITVHANTKAELEAIQKNRNSWLLSYSEFGNAESDKQPSPREIVAQNFNDLLLLDSDPQEEEWFKLLIGDEKTSSKVINPEKAKEQFENELTQIAYDFYPDLTEETLAQINIEWHTKDEGYMTMLQIGRASCRERVC